MHERHMWGHAILFSYKTMTTMHYNRSYGRFLGFQHGLKRFQTIFDCGLVFRSRFEWHFSLVTSP